MNYHQMLPVVDEWVLWVLGLLSPLVALCALTAFIVLHREWKTATLQKKYLNLVMAGSSGLMVLFILGFMLYSGLRIEENRANATENIMAKYDIASVEWKTPEGKETNPTDTVTERLVMVSDQGNNISVFRYSTNPETGAPELKNTVEGDVDDNFRRIPAENLLR